MVVDGTTYPDGTPERVIQILEAARTQRMQRYGDGRYPTSPLGSRERLHIHYGNPETGEDWLELYGTEGYVSRSMGQVRVPLLIHNDRSMGGCPILVDHIVRIRQCGGNWRELYRHPSYAVPLIELKYNYQQWLDGPITRSRLVDVSLVRHESGTVHSTWKTSKSARYALRRLGGTTPDRFVEATAQMLVGAA